MKFVLKPSLQHMTLVKIVVSLFNQNDVRNLIRKLGPPSYFTTRDEQLKKIEVRVIKKVPLLPLPQCLKEKVLGFIKPIGLEILMWKDYNHKYFPVNLPAELCWTPQGTVDRKRTAKVLISDETLDISTRYEIACHYCLEDDVHKFWNSMPKNLKESVSYKSSIIRFWSRNMKRRELRIVHIDYKDQFLKSVYWNNRVAAEYFLEKLTPRERKKSLKKAAKYVTDDDVLYFLISEMNEKQMGVYKNNPLRVLECFLKWPLQSFFIDIANCMWDFLSAKHFNLLFDSIIGKLRDGYNDWSYQQLFSEFLQKSPSAVKSLFINESDKNHLLFFLLEAKDKENIRFFLKDTTFIFKEKLIYSYTMNKFCESSIRDDEWNILEFFIRECLPSKNAMLNLKNRFEKRKYFKDCPPSKKHQWNRLFSFSDDSICKYGKRSLEEGESSSSKQFRNLE